MDKELKRKGVTRALLWQRYNVTQEKKKTELLKLEGRIMLLLLIMKLAEETKDNKLLFETDQRFQDLLFEYKDSGGDRKFNL
jgi:hypothetical protein